jgi:hypothetical protein
MWAWPNSGAGLVLFLRNRNKNRKTHRFFEHFRPSLAEFYIVSSGIRLLQTSESVIPELVSSKNPFDFLVTTLRRGSSSFYIAGSPTKLCTKL